MEAVFNHLRNKGGLAARCDHFVSCPAEGSARVLPRFSFGCKEGRVAHAERELLIRLEGWAQNACHRPSATLLKTIYTITNWQTPKNHLQQCLVTRLASATGAGSKVLPSMPGLPQP